ncbi:hypothetical protein D3C86_2181540 [compost metagenome]
MFAGLFEGVGLADNPLAEYRDLIRTDDQMGRMTACKCAGFFFGEALYQFGG